MHLVLRPRPSKSVSAAEVRQLRADAVRDGDLVLVAICDRALDMADDSPAGYEAWMVCETVVLSARAMRDVS